MFHFKPGYIFVPVDELNLKEELDSMLQSPDLLSQSFRLQLFVLYLLRELSGHHFNVLLFGLEVSDGLLEFLLLLLESCGLCLVPFSKFGYLLFVDLLQVFLLFLLGYEEFALVVLAFLLDLGHFLGESGLVLLGFLELFGLHLALRLCDGEVACSFSFFEEVLVVLSHSVVLLHPTLIFNLTLVLGEGKAVCPFLEFLLVSHFETDLLQRNVLIELLDLKLQLHLYHLRLLLPQLATLTTCLHY